MIAPSPRYRLYGSWMMYRSILADLVLGRLSEGNDVERLEADLRDFLGAKHVLCMPQNRVGMYLAIKHLIKPGQEVVMSPYTIADITNMVILAGGRPVFADVERETCNISASEVARSISERTGAVLITHLHGLAAPVEEILDLCKKHSIPLIEDTAQGFGAKVGGRRLGTIGRVGVYSFGLYKNVNGFMGGAISTDDPVLIEGIRRDLLEYSYQSSSILFKKIVKGVIADLLTSPVIFKLFTFWVFRFGFLHDIEAINSKVRTELDVSRKSEVPDDYLARITPAQARVIRPQLGHVDRHSAERIRRAKIYHQGLEGINGLIIPPLLDDFSHIYTYFPVQYSDRERLLKYLMRNGADVAAQHYKNNAALPGFAEFARVCTNAAAVAEQLIFLPTYPRYPVSDIERNIRIIQRFFQEEV